MKQVQAEGTKPNKVDLKRVLYLRPSSFTYCPLRAFFNLRLAFSKKVLEPFDKSYYTNVGTATHLVWQSCAESSGIRIVKDWLCSNKECSHRHVLVANPRKCKKCSSPVYGAEHEIAIGSIRGHVDEILEVTLPDGKLGYIPVDYKSTSTKGLAYKKKNPGEAYVAQISAYATLLSRSLNVVGWCLVFFSRDNPNKVEYHASTKLLELSKLKTWSRQHRKLLALESWDEVRELIANRMCRSRQDVEKKARFCAYASYCTSEDRQCRKHAKVIFSKLEDRLPLNSLLK